MKIKKFTAATIPEALRLVRNDMGDEALILGASRSRSRRGRSGRVEVVAARGGGARSPSEDYASDRPGRRNGAMRPGSVKAGDAVMAAGRATRKGSSHETREIKEMRKLDRDIVSELKQIESRLKELLEGLDKPSTRLGERPLQVNRDIINAGFDPELLEGKVPAALLRGDTALDQLIKALVGGVPIAPTEDRILVFLGPSGSGKTTTLLKVARSVFLDDKVKPRVVFLGNNDEDTSWLKARCKHLGLKFTYVSRLDKLAKILKKEKSPLLIDTPGISDLGDAEMRFLVEASKEIPGMGLRLVVDANMDPWNMCAIASCIPRASEMSLVLTKLDEATRIGGAVSVSIASGIPVAFVTGGRHAADGVHVPDAGLLSEKILDSVGPETIREAGGRA